MECELTGGVQIGVIEYSYSRLSCEKCYKICIENNKNSSTCTSTLPSRSIIALFSVR